MLRRFEILLPLDNNDGTRIDRTKHLQTWRELLIRFGGVTLEPQTLEGHWLWEGREYQDQLIRLVVVAEDTPETIAFFHAFKEVLKERFQQIDIWITSYLIDRY